MKLAYEHTLGAVYDKLAAADHYRNLAEVDLLLDRLLLVQPHPDAKGHTVGQTKLAALIDGVKRLSQLVPEIFEAILAVIAVDGEYLAQQPLQAHILALFGRDMLLEKLAVALRLNLDEIRYRYFLRGSAVSPYFHADLPCPSGPKCVDPGPKPAGLPKNGSGSVPSANRRAF